MPYLVTFVVSSSKPLFEPSHLVHDGLHHINDLS